MSINREHQRLALLHLPSIDFEALTDPAKQAITYALEGYTKIIQLEHIHFNGGKYFKSFYSFRYSKKERLIVCLTNDGRWIITKDLKDHDYRSYLKKLDLNALQRQLDDLDKPPLSCQVYNKDLPDKRLTVPRDYINDWQPSSRAFFYKRRWITLTSHQVDWLNAILQQPGIITGPPGSGKSAIAYTLICELDRINQIAKLPSKHPFLYLAPTPLLAAEAARFLENNGVSSSYKCHTPASLVVVHYVNNGNATTKKQMAFSQALSEFCANLSTKPNISDKRLPRLYSLFCCAENNLDFFEALTPRLDNNTREFVWKFCKYFQSLHPNAFRIVSYRYFHDWLDEHRKTRASDLGERLTIDSQTLYSEFQTYQHGGSDKIRYLNAGVKQSLISRKEQRELLITLYDNYQSHLKTTDHIDPLLSSLNSPKQPVFSYTVLDECQQLWSYGLIKWIISATDKHDSQKPRIAFAGDPEQRTGHTPTTFNMNFAEKLLDIDKLPLFHCDISFRVPQVTTPVLNKLLMLTNQTVGLQKGTPLLIPISEDADIGVIGWTTFGLHQNQLKILAMHPETLIISFDQPYSVERYQSANIFSPTTAIGYECNYVIVDMEKINQHDLKELLKIYRASTSEETDKGTGPKNKENAKLHRYRDLLNQIRIAMTRARLKVFFVCDTPHLIESLMCQLNIKKIDKDNTTIFDTNELTPDQKK